jgi:nucleotidyltransferase/DNA polymerase involved in DNA repair
MTFLCIWTETQIRPGPLFHVVPRIVVERDVLWADVRGLPFGTMERIHAVVKEQGCTSMRMGMSAIPIVAHVAALHGTDVVTQVPAGSERDFLAPFPVTILRPNPRLANLLDGAGIESCGELARLTRESVEVRFGVDGTNLWKLARADDPRLIFGTIPRTAPSASLEWTDYVLRRVERLVFVINGLCGNVCETLRGRGEGAVVMVVQFTLANQTVHQYPIRAARATASQTAWMRLLRLGLERVVLPDAVTGIALTADVIGPLGGKQGDVFDLGFGTAHAAEEAIAGMLDDQGAVVVEPRNTAHPLLDRRTAWVPLNATQAIEQHVSAKHSHMSALTLQLLPTPTRITVALLPCRGAPTPRSYRDGSRSYKIIEAAGPDRVSGERWADPYAREYYRCVNEEGTLVWLYRDCHTDTWYLHGWWD